MLVGDVEEVVQLAVAGNAKTSTGTRKLILEELAYSSSESVREEVTKNFSTSFKTLKQLAVDKEERVRLAAISNIISHPESEWKK